MKGLHLTADLSGCPGGGNAALLVEPDALRALCQRAVAGAGLTAVAELFHAFPSPGGVTGVVLLAESHLAVHTWPETGAVTLDVYVCRDGARAETLLAALLDAFAPARVERHRIERGSAA